MNVETERGDRAVYEDVREPLMRFAASLVGPGAAADLVSEVIESTLRRQSLSSLSNPHAYLMKALFNRATSLKRRWHRESDALQLHATASVPDASDLISTSDGEVYEIVARLPARQRAAIYLVYWEDMTPTNAATMLGVKPGTLRRYLHIARERIRRCLDG